MTNQPKTTTTPPTEFVLEVQAGIAGDLDIMLNRNALFTNGDALTQLIEHRITYVCCEGMGELIIKAEPIKARRLPSQLLQRSGVHHLAVQAGEVPRHVLEQQRRVAHGPVFGLVVEDLELQRQGLSSQPVDPGVHTVGVRLHNRQGLR